MKQVCVYMCTMTNDCQLENLVCVYIISCYICVLCKMLLL